MILSEVQKIGREGSPEEPMIREREKEILLRAKGSVEREKEVIPRELKSIEREKEILLRVEESVEREKEVIPGN